jgi:hypothetical protein
VSVFEGGDWSIPRLKVPEDSGVRLAASGLASGDVACEPIVDGEQRHDHTPVRRRVAVEPGVDMVQMPLDHVADGWMAGRGENVRYLLQMSLLRGLAADWAG